MTPLGDDELDADFCENDNQSELEQRLELLRDADELTEVRSIFSPGIACRRAFASLTYRELSTAACAGLLHGELLQQLTAPALSIGDAVDAPGDVDLCAVTDLLHPLRGQEFFADELLR